MTIDGTAVDVPGRFSCADTWDGGVFTCVITGCPFDTCAKCGMECPNVIWMISLQDPADRPLDAGQIHAGVPYNNSYAAHCQ